MPFRYEDRPAVPEIEQLRHLLMRCETILQNMALENEGSILNRWPINHEPLRADARNLLPAIRAALDPIQKGGMPFGGNYG